MLKKFIAVLFGAALALGLAAAPAQATAGQPLHGCPWADVCIYNNPNYSNGQTNQTYAAIKHASNSCWQFSASWNNTISSWVANFDTPPTFVRLYDSTNCTGAYQYGGQAVVSAASMGTWDNRAGSLQLL